MTQGYAPFKPLIDRIRRDGRCLEGGILKVDGFINHQIDPMLLNEIAHEFVSRFKGSKIDKIITVESSGIAPAILAGLYLGVPVVFAKKKKPSTMGDMYVTEVFSFTKNRSYTVCCSKEFLREGNRLLFIDDFLANGNAAKGIVDLATQAGATIVGMGFIVEKSFQQGGKALRELGYQVESLAIIDSLDNCQITFEE